MKISEKFVAVIRKAWTAFWQLPLSHSFFFWPLIAMAGRLVFRMVMNVWDMIEA